MGRSARFACANMLGKHASCGRGPFPLTPLQERRCCCVYTDWSCCPMRAQHFFARPHTYISTCFISHRYIHCVPLCLVQQTPGMPAYNLTAEGTLCCLHSFSFPAVYIAQLELSGRAHRFALADYYNGCAHVFTSIMLAVWCCCCTQGIAPPTNRLAAGAGGAHPSSSFAQHGVTLLKVCSEWSVVHNRRRRQRQLGSNLIVVPASRQSLAASRLGCDLH